MPEKPNRQVEFKQIFLLHPLPRTLDFYSFSLFFCSRDTKGQTSVAEVKGGEVQSLFRSHSKVAFPFVLCMEYSSMI